MQACIAERHCSCLYIQRWLITQKTNFVVNAHLHTQFEHSLAQLHSLQKVMQVCIGNGHGTCLYIQGWLVTQRSNFVVGAHLHT